MQPQDALRDLELLFQSRYGLIHIHTDEADRALYLLQHVADRISTPLFTWSRIEGIKRVGWKGSIFETKEAQKAMAHVVAADIPAIYHFHGVGPHLETDEVFRAQVKAGARKLETVHGAIVFTGTDITLPPDLDPMAAKVLLPAPVEEEYRSLLGNLLRDLSHRQYVVANPLKAEEFGLSFPRGVLLLGVPGCGKSLSAKAVASEWGLPLLKFDTSNLYNKYIGESEKNFKRAIRAAERMAPVVLWIDELEKAFAVGGTEDGGVSQRILGSFLNWMQDRTGEVFIVATANAIERLPPEFLRKGRFDEIFFVDLPDAETRGEIFRIHLASRGQDPGNFDLERLARESEGFTGSEIEEVVVSGLYTAFSDSSTLTTEDLEREVRGTVPLSVTMAEKVSALRAWAGSRTVRAN